MPLLPSNFKNKNVRDPRRNAYHNRTVLGVRLPLIHRSDEEDDRHGASQRNCMGGSSSSSICFVWFESCKKWRCVCDSGRGLDSVVNVVHNRFPSLVRGRTSQTNAPRTKHRSISANRSWRRWIVHGTNGLSAHIPIHGPFYNKSYENSMLQRQATWYNHDRTRSDP